MKWTSSSASRTISTHTQSIELLNRMGWIIGAPSKRRIKGKLSVTKTAFPINKAATNAVKKPLNSMPCSCRMRRLVQRIRLKPTRKKIVGGSACLTCASHQLKARRTSPVGVAEVIAGWLICYSPRFAPSYQAAAITERCQQTDANSAERLQVRGQFY